MSDFKSTKEIWEYLLSGGKVKSKLDPVSCPDHLMFDDNGTLRDINGNFKEQSFAWPNHWMKFVEPKKMKKITLYRYTFFADSSGATLQSTWNNLSWDKYALGIIENELCRILKTESKEIEIEE